MLCQLSHAAAGEADQKITILQLFYLLIAVETPFASP